MQIQVISIFPEVFSAITKYGVISRALANGLWQFSVINPREFSGNTMGYIDDRPFGGGSGMVMRLEPLLKAYHHAKKNLKSASCRLIYLSPQGCPLNYAKVRELSHEDDLVLLCGRYEGIDERFLSITKAEEISVGDFVVSGGELPAMLLMDSVLRCLPGVLGDLNSAQEDSFVNGLLDYPQYTRPVEFDGYVVPEVLLSGHHAHIERWRLKQSLMRTLEKRPDLLDGRNNNPEESCLLEEILQERQD
ncbi:MAG: tRNA (guanosine(37)-N1)-methyltransferase TrmD [Neisseriaceae bacterium]|nr:MAG: tRNA (guanosine(37)-N1)-methyltransferase TrmD [Neisseriaceae bacterium]